MLDAYSNTPAYTVENLPDTVTTVTLDAEAGSPGELYDLLIWLVACGCRRMVVVIGADHSTTRLEQRALVVAAAVMQSRYGQLRLVADAATEVRLRDAGWEALLPVDPDLTTALARFGAPPTGWDISETIAC